MKFSTLFRLFAAIAFLWLLTISTAAQESGAGFGSYTRIDYDEETNTVTAYSETNVDYELTGDYTPRVWLTVTNEYGAVVTSGFGYNNGDGFASVELNFAGEAGRTYTAVGTHRAIISLWEQEDFYPYQTYYFDSWYFSNYEGVGIYQPWYYYFTRPSYSLYRRHTATVSLGRTYDSVSTTEAKPTVTISGPSNAMDGDTVEFSVSVQDNTPNGNPNNTPTGYQWSFEPTSGGNNPQVNFSNSTGTTTSAKAHWFAKPDDECTASFNSTYTIKVKVTFQGRSPITKEAPFTVNAYWFPTGDVDYPLTLGQPQYFLDTNRNLWTVVGPMGEDGGLRRVVSPIQNYIPERSQFHNKIQRHEEVHVTQWTTGRWSDLYVIDDLMPRLLTLTNSSLQPLQQEVFNKKQEWREEQRQELIRRLPAGEREAYDVSDQIAPRYLYNNCRRFR